jgi:hypothetical protein
MFEPDQAVLAPARIGVGEEHATYLGRASEHGGNRGMALVRYADGERREVEPACVRSNRRPSAPLVETAADGGVRPPRRGTLDAPLDFRWTGQGLGLAGVIRNRW